MPKLLDILFDLIGGLFDGGRGDDPFAGGEHDQDNDEWRMLVQDDLQYDEFHGELPNPEDFNTFE